MASALLKVVNWPTTGHLTPVFPENAVLLFYSPLSASDSVMPAGGASAATPAYAYTYQLTGTPAVRPEYYIRERRVVRAEITVERRVNLTGLGATGLNWFRLLSLLTCWLDSDLI